MSKNLPIDAIAKAVALVQMITNQSGGTLTNQQIAVVLQVAMEDLKELDTSQTQQPGTKSRQPCQDCQEPMFWTSEAIRHDSARGTSAGQTRPDPYFEAAYVCSNKHISDACALCHSRDTLRYRDTRSAEERLVSCNACGDITTVSSESES